MAIGRAGGLAVVVSACAHQGGASRGQELTPEYDAFELQALYDEGRCQEYLTGLKHKTWKAQSRSEASGLDVQQAECLRQTGREADARALFGLVAREQAGSLLGNWASARLANESYNPPSALRRVEPKYPVDAYRRGVTGVVDLRFDVSAQGTTEQVQVISGDPPGVFDKAARAAVKQWRYTPAARNGTPVRARGLSLRIQFRLGG